MYGVNLKQWHENIRYSTDVLGRPSKKIPNRSKNGSFLCMFTFCQVLQSYWS